MAEHAFGIALILKLCTRKRIRLNQASIFLEWHWKSCGIMKKERFKMELCKIMKIRKSISIQYWNVQDIEYLMDKKSVGLTTSYWSRPGVCRNFTLSCRSFSSWSEENQGQIFSDRKLNRPAVKYTMFTRRIYNLYINSVALLW